MKISRNVTNLFNWLLDQIFPPVVRDSKILMAPMFYLLFGKKSSKFMKFKEQAFNMSEDELVNYYKELSGSHIKRETDLNTKSIKYILNNIRGQSVLDISCGRGYLANKIVRTKDIKVTGADFIISPHLKSSKNPKFIEASIENIPFPDKSFDTVICTHTLEHVVDIKKAIKELRRVCRQRLIIVVPKQREYKYTFDLHLHFFPYKYSVENLTGQKATIINLNNDWLCTEDFFN